jgi:hypothetical protein
LVIFALHELVTFESLFLSKALTLELACIIQTLVFFPVAGFAED